MQRRNSSRLRFRWHFLLTLDGHSIGKEHVDTNTEIFSRGGGLELCMKFVFDFQLRTATSVLPGCVIPVLQKQFVRNIVVLPFLCVLLNTSMLQV